VLPELQVIPELLEPLELLVTLATQVQLEPLVTLVLPELLALLELLVTLATQVLLA
jgi:hypothetical protein